MKTLLGQFRLVRAASLGAIGLVLAGQAVPSLAQDAQSESRLRKVEAEVRALQRKVFPGADGKVFQPEITAGTPAATGPGLPATTAVTDLLSRVDALEAAVARLTNQFEENNNRLRQIETRLGPVEGAAETLAPAPVVTPPAAAGSLTPAPAAVPAPAAAPVSPPAAAAAPAAPPKAAPAGRVEAVRAIEKPQTEDAGDDDYSYGFRLWDAKFYPEAQQQLKLYIQKYPKHARISYGRNLLGRAYLDAGNANEAAKWFLQNYQADKNGARAPDSLLYLGVAMKDLKDSKRACIALAEFSETYVAEASGRLKGTYDATRNGLKCS